jgi:hypothetical protein
MKAIGWIHVLLGLLAIGSGTIVLQGVMKVELSWNPVARFLRYSLIASVAGLLPLTPQLSPIQGICMLSVYCAGAVILAWRKFHLAGLWRPVFAFFIVACFYLNVVSVSFRLCKDSLPFEMASMESGSPFEVAQFLFASVSAVLGVLAVRKCHTQPQRTHSV